MNLKVFYKLMLSFLKVQNNKCEVSLQYLKSELSYKVDVLHHDKHDSPLQIDSIIFYGFDQAFPN